MPRAWSVVWDMGGAPRKSYGQNEWARFLVLRPHCLLPRQEADQTDWNHPKWFAGQVHPRRPNLVPCGCSSRSRRPRDGTAREHRASGHDVVLDYAPETRVGDLAAALSRTGAEMPTNVVALPGAGSVPTLTGPVDLYLGDEMLDPGQTDRRRAPSATVSCSASAARPRNGVPNLAASSRCGSRRAPAPATCTGSASAGPRSGTAGTARIRIPELADDPQLGRPGRGAGPRRRDRRVGHDHAGRRRGRPRRCRCPCGASR